MGRLGEYRKGFQLSTIDDRVYALCLPARPGSVRDSMWRAERLVDSLSHQHELSNKRTAIIGLGPSGMSAALALLRRGASVVGCNLPASRFAEANLMNCNTRWLCPTTFDWPHDWQTRKTHWTDNSALMGWKADIASTVIAKLQRVFDRRIAQYVESGHYRQHDPAVWSCYTCDASHIELALRRPHSCQPIDTCQADVVLICTGPGNHCNNLPTSTGAFHGYGFWSSEDDLFDIPTRSSVRRVLILGAQDGGVGDFARLLTGIEDPWDLLCGLQLTDAYMDRIRNLNDAMWREFGSGEASTDHETLARLQVESIEFINEVWAGNTMLRQNAEQILLPDDSRPHVQLVVDCHHFGLAYFANRIAAHLLARALMRRGVHANGYMRPFRIGCRGAFAECLNGSCTGSAGASAAHRHSVHFMPYACSGGGPCPEVIELCNDHNDEWAHTVTTSLAPQECERIVLRFGADYSPRHLPTDIVRAVRSQELIRDVPPFYTGA